MYNVAFCKFSSIYVRTYICAFDWDEVVSDRNPANYVSAFHVDQR